jgi:hypothetical protein
MQVLEWLFKQCRICLNNGVLLAVVAGVFWIIVFCCTSSLAMGTPWMGFMRDEFGWSKIKELGLLEQILVLGLPTVIFKEGVFDEYDWAGTVSLVVFCDV